MAVDIYQTGDDGCALQVNGIFGNNFGQHRAEPAVPHFKAAGDKPEIRGEDSGVFIEHRKISFTVYLQEYSITNRQKKQSTLPEKFSHEKKQ